MDRAADLLRGALARGAADGRADELLARAELRRDRATTAVEHAELAVQRRAEDPAARRTRGRCFVALGEGDAAAADFTWVLGHVDEHSPRRPIVTADLGDAFAVEGRFDEAVDQWLLAVRDPRAVPGEPVPGPPLAARPAIAGVLRERLERAPGDWALLQISGWIHAGVDDAAALQAWEAIAQAPPRTLAWARSQVARLRDGR